MTNFNEALEFVLANEAGFVVDNGGPTNFGITLPTLEEYRGKPVTQDDLQKIARPEVESVYKKLYWDKMQLSALVQQSVATMLFDAGVNRSTRVAIMYAQRIVNKTLNAGLDVDGVMGPLTLVAINSCAPGVFIKNFVDLEHAGNLAIVDHKPDLAKYLKGWDNRAQRLLTLI